MSACIPRDYIKIVETKIENEAELELLEKKGLEFMFRNQDDSALACFEKVSQSGYVDSEKSRKITLSARRGSAIIREYRMDYKGSIRDYLACVELTKTSVESEIYLYKVIDVYRKSRETGHNAVIKKALSGLRDDALANTHLKNLAGYFLLKKNYSAGKLTAAKRIADELGFIKEWFIIGSFSDEGKSGFETDYPVEKKTNIDEEYQGKERKVRWRKLRIKPDYGYVDFANLFAPDNNSVGYALCYFYVPNDVKAVIGFGSDNAGKVWIDRALVIAEPLYRNCAFDQNVAGVKLDSGWHRMLVKVCQDKGRWGFMARITDTNGKNIKGIKFARDKHDIVGIEPGSAEKADLKEWDVAGFMDSIERGDPYEKAVHGYLASFIYRIKKNYDSSQRRDFFEIEKAHNAFPLSCVFSYEYGRLHPDGNKKKLLMEKTVKLNNYHLEAKQALAEYYFSLGRMDRAESIADGILTERGDAYRTRVLRLGVLRARGWGVEYRRDLLDSMKRFPKDSGLHFLLGKYYEKNGGLDSAVAEYMTALKYNCGRNDVRDRIMKIQLSRNQTEDALKTIEREMRYEPYNWDNYALKARIYEKDRNYDSGLAELNNALEIRPEEYRIHFIAGLYHKYLGNNEKAISEWEQALSFKPNYTYLREYMNFLRNSEDAEFKKHCAGSEEILSREIRSADYPMASGITLLDEKVEKVYENGTSSSMSHEIIRIVNENGIRRYSSKKIYYHPSKESVEVKVARSISPEGKPVDASAISDRPIFGDELMYSDLFVKTIDFTNLEKDSVIEIEYKIDHFGENIFADYFGSISFFEYYDPVVLSKYALIFPKSRQLNVSTNGDVNPPEITETEKERTYVWTEKDSKQILYEAGMPPFYEVSKYVRVSTFKGWDEMTRWYMGLVKDQFVINDPRVKEKIKALTRDCRDRDSKIRAVYNFIVTEIRYLGLEFGISGYKPYKADLVFANKYGDCKDKATLMIAMLKECGIDANIVLLRTRDLGDIKTDIAGLHIFNHAIVFVPSENPVSDTDGVWLDGTAQFHNADELPDMDQGAIALIAKKDRGALTKIPVSKSGQNLWLARTDVSMYEDGSARCERKMELKGQYCPFYRYRYLVKEKREEDIEMYWNNRFAGAQVDRVEFSEIENLDAPVKFSYLIKIPNYARKSDGTMQLKTTLSEWKMTEKYAFSSGRNYDLHLDFPYLYRKSYSITIPDGFVVDRMPESAEFSRKFGTFVMSFEKKDRTVTIDQTVELRQNVIRKEDYPDFREFCNLIDRKESEEIVIKKK